MPLARGEATFNASEEDQIMYIQTELHKGTDLVWLVAGYR